MAGCPATSALKAWPVFYAELGAALLLTNLLTPTLPEGQALLVLLIEPEAPGSESGTGAISLCDLVAPSKVIVVDSAELRDPNSGVITFLIAFFLGRNFPYNIAH